MVDYGVLGIVYTSFVTALLAGVRYWLYQDSLRVPARRMHVVITVISVISATVWFLIRDRVTLPFSLYRVIVATLLFGLSCYIIREPFTKHAFSYAFIMAYDVTFEAIASYVQGICPVQTSPYVYVATSAVIIALTFAPAFRLLKRMIDSLNGIDNDKLWSTLCVLCFTFLFMNLLFTFPPKERMTLLALVSRLLTFGGMTAVYATATRVMRTMRDSAEMRMNLNMTERRISAQQEYYDRLVAQMDEVRRMRHDIRHHRTALVSLIQAGDMTALSEYIQQMPPIDSAIPISGNFAVDSLLLYYREEAMHHGIALDIDCVFNVPLPVSDPDICVMLGNLMENAIEASLRIPQTERHISILARCDVRGLTMSLENSFDGVLERTNDVIMSRKEVGRRGIGLQSVQTLCSKYDGVFNVSAEDDIFRAGIIVLPLKA